MSAKKKITTEPGETSFGPAISILPPKPLSRKIDALKKQLGISRARFGLLSYELVVDKIERGEAEVRNGKLRLIDKAA